MRKNLPITDNEKTFPSNQKLISSTDLKGKIRHCNSAFVEEQAQVSDQINKQVETISDLATSNLAKGEESTECVRSIDQIAKGLHELVVRFK
ncbi:MAG TPA: hypothetical protein DEP13_07780 [Gammaproteobacteria bacterium]|nr:hypothetical protein [Gammaproteobacteria bacterium]